MIDFLSEKTGSKDRTQNSSPLYGLNHALTAMNGDIMPKQCTLRHAVQAKGIGRYTRQFATITLEPAPADTGIVFKRIDLNPIVYLPARLDYMQCSPLYTSLARGSIKIHGAASLMSVFAGLGIDNAYVSLNRSELPYMDGSAEPFVFLIQSAGIQTQSSVRQTYVRVTKKMQMTDYPSWMTVEPCESLRITAIHGTPTHTYSTTLSPRTYIKSLSRARQGMDSFPERPLRYPDEPIRNDILRLLGDLYTSGFLFLGDFKIYHPRKTTLLHQLMEHLLKTVEATSLMKLAQNYGKLASV